MTLPGGALVIVVPWWLLILLVTIGLTVLWVIRRSPVRSWEAVSAEIQFAELGKVTIQPNREDIQLAHKAWVELATRKAGIPFDPNYDLVLDIYGSWYELFGRLRSITSDCPATKIRNDQNTRELVDTLVKVLNRGIRPHLTRWHAQFRRWYVTALGEAGPDETPQDVQRRYPQYADLIGDLATVQEGLQRYMNLLKQLSTGA